MHNLLLLIPFISGFIAWLSLQLMVKMLFHPLQPMSFLGRKIQGIIPKQQLSLANDIAKTVNQQLRSSDLIEQKITSPETLQKIMPQIELHIDDFLRVKLPIAMPMIGMFIGERTIGELKEVFMAELQILFPEVLKNYLRQLENDIDVEQLITQKITQLSPVALEAAFKNKFGRQINNASAAVALLGFLIGLLQLWIAWVA